MAKKHSWIVTARVVLIREYITDDCTEAEARESFDSRSIDEIDTDTIEVEFQKIEPNN